MSTSEAFAQDRAVVQRSVERGIARLRHFTTNAGLTGVLATGAVQSRDLLSEDEYLDRIYFPNCEIRHDPEWTGFVNVSITDINGSFFNICSGSSNWHRGMDGFWAVLEIDPVVLSHPGVVFATTNNRYSNVKRGRRVEGLEAMFADVVHPYRPVSSSPVLTREGLGTNQPTDVQAEVLYPGAVPLEFLTAVLVRSEDDLHSAVAQVGYFSQLHDRSTQVEVRVDPTAFLPREPNLSFASPADVDT